jgi:hypothetical protein
MDDFLVIAAIVYLFLASSVIAILPDDFFSTPEGGGFDDWSSPLEITAFLFVPFIIPGVPVIIGSLLALLNYLCLFIGGVFIYDKLRGI